MDAIQCKMARVAAGWGVRELASVAGVSPDTVSRLERGEELKENTVALLRAALEAGGIQFLEAGATADGVGVALKR